MTRRTARILIVDDEPLNVDYLEQELDGRGCRPPDTAANGLEALERIAAASPDIVLLDVMMPGMDGFATLRILKEDPDTRLIPVVLMTALNAVDDRVRGIEAGADDFLSKPVDERELLARIKTALTPQACDRRDGRELATHERSSGAPRTADPGGGHPRGRLAAPRPGHARGGRRLRRAPPARGRRGADPRRAGGTLSESATRSPSSPCSRVRMSAAARSRPSRRRSLCLPSCRSAPSRRWLDEPRDRRRAGAMSVRPAVWQAGEARWVYWRGGPAGSTGPSGWRAPPPMTAC